MESKFRCFYYTNYIKEKEKITMEQNIAKNNKTESCGMTKDQMIEKMEKINRGHKDNLESRRNALNILISSIPVGGKVFAIIPLNELYIDESYQRSLQNHVKIIARDWNPTKCDPLKINFREDGFFYVWDGQHRLEAARLRRIRYLLCDIVVGLTQAQEAELFGCQGVGIKKPDPYDIFKANVCAGEEIDIAIKNMCDKYDLLVNRNNKKSGNLSCLTLARDIFKHGEEDREYFEWVLELLHIARWNEFPQSHCHRIISSLYEIRKSSGEKNEFVQKKLICYLKETNPDELLINATVKYPQFKDQSKKLKLFLLDIINSDEEVSKIFNGQGRFIA